jgi:hypothetical protein
MLHDSRVASIEPTKSGKNNVSLSFKPLILRYRFRSLKPKSKYGRFAPTKRFLFCQKTAFLIKKQAKTLKSVYQKKGFPFHKFLDLFRSMVTSSSQSGRINVKGDELEVDNPSFL